MDFEIISGVEEVKINGDTITNIIIIRIIPVNPPRKLPNNLFIKFREPDL